MKLLDDRFKETTLKHLIYYKSSSFLTWFNGNLASLLPSVEQFSRKSSLFCTQKPNCLLIRRKVPPSQPNCSIFATKLLFFKVFNGDTPIQNSYEFVEQKEWLLIIVCFSRLYDYKVVICLRFVISNFLSWEVNKRK